MYVEYPLLDQYAQSVFAIVDRVLRNVKVEGHGGNALPKSNDGSEGAVLLGILNPEADRVWVLGLWVRAAL